MEITILLLKMWGFYLFLMGLSVLINKEMWKNFVGELPNNKHFVFLAGMFALVIGMIVIALHNVWSGGFNVVIVTLFGWLSFIKGIGYLLFPSKSVASIAKRFMAGSWSTSWAAVILILGVYMLFAGFAVV